MEEGDLKPKGTVAVLIVFALAIVVFWVVGYLALLLRGAAQ
jgi:hypothetical protein